MKTDNVKKIIHELDFQTALRRIKYDSKFDFIQLPIEIVIYEHYFDDNIKFLIESIEDDSYVVKPLRKIWVPKRNFFLRPGSIPHLEDRLLFQAMIDSVASELEAQMIPLDHEVVFSSRLNPDQKNEKLFIHPRELWLSFKNKCVSFCDNQEVNFVLVSDIASYFENIDLRLLADTLTSLGVSPFYSESIRQLLSIWANGRTRGIPQMIAPCSFLANIYLNQVDKNMIMRGYNYVRYVDDIRIFVSSERELRIALKDLTEQLKGSYLDVQASKTKFMSAKDLKAEITTLEKHLNELGIDANEQAALSYFDPLPDDQRIPEDKLLVFLENLIHNTEYDDRHLRFCINHLSYIKSPAAINLVISHLQDMPQETDTFVNYLQRLPPEHLTKDMLESIMQFLDSELNIYDWQMMLLLRLIAKYNRIDYKYLQRLFNNSKIFDHPVNRAITTYILCSKGDLTLKRNFISRYGQESKIVQMATLCGVFDLNKKERNRFYAVAAKDRDLNQLIKILKNKKVDFC